MIRLGRLAGALLLENANTWHLLGNPKEPCDFVAPGFAPPSGEIDAVHTPTLRLVPSRQVTMNPPWVALHTARPDIAAHVARRLLISRNGSVSERLWRLITDPDDTEITVAGLDVTWLIDTPEVIWNIVRDTVLRCT